MSAVLMALAVGFLGARFLFLAGRPCFAAFVRPNYRDRWIPTATGVVLAVTAVVVEGVRVAAGAAGVGGGAGMDLARVLTLVTVVGFSLLGLVDDVAGTPEHRGYRGHLTALARGTFTTGAMKLVVGSALALAVVASATPGASLGAVMRDAALVALAANLGNLLDRAPGRVIKAGTLAFAMLAAGTRADAQLVATGVVTGASLGLLPEDLRERLMLGDAGANALGGALGLAAVLATTVGVRTAAVVVLAGLNLAGEVSSFSRVIEAVRPLRAVDRAGRRPQGPGYE